ncbi:hypothetical protein WJX74_003443 [Apatococcus lobatus]|uniref:phosphatidyl-N-methylethanolamine N-methyltransferase n=1 Tax=Apatococcus lobatus TaxID=904363 RepID=A0AAW1RZE9_9CHLO
MAPDQVDWLVTAALAAPHVLYAFIWLLPNVWLSFSSKKPKRAVYNMEFCAWLLKVVQASAVLWWYHCKNPGGLHLDMDQVALHQWVAFVGLAGLGQALNLSIYDAIGSEGVYYGTKLGLHVPWHKGFPFNFVAHPQYVGSVMTIWAVVAVLYNQGPAGQGLSILACYWSGLYMITAMQEQYL